MNFENTIWENYEKIKGKNPKFYILYFTSKIYFNISSARSAERKASEPADRSVAEGGLEAVRSDSCRPNQPSGSVHTICERFSEQYIIGCRAQRFLGFGVLGHWGDWVMSTNFTQF